jgi:DEAD/DEAH box helicase domain protein
MEFKALGFDERVLEGLSSMGYEAATPIQEQAIPIIQQGRDLIGCAQTGTGKTAAFVLPIIDKLLRTPVATRGSSVLILAPTHELVQQIDQQIDGLGYFTAISSKTIYGGKDADQWSTQRNALNQGADIIVANPGRLLQFITLEIARLENIHTLVLDEADVMLDMGFLPDIQAIIAKLPVQRQTLLFSATMPEAVRKLANAILVEPLTVEIATSKPAEKVEQLQFPVEKEKKTPFLVQYLQKHPEHKSTIVFVRRKNNVQSLVRSLNRAKISACGVSANFTQEEREKALQDFKARNLSVLVATDILARGIDIEDVNLVVNYDAPTTVEAYVHRVGRTARASARGMALLLIAPEEGHLLHRIERHIEKNLTLLAEDWTENFKAEFIERPKRKRKKTNTVQQKNNLQQNVAKRIKHKPKHKKRSVANTEERQGQN